MSLKSLLLFSHSVMLDSLRTCGQQHARLPCPSTPRAYSNSCSSHPWCHPTILFSVVPFSSCLLFFPASGSFLTSWLFTSGGQSIKVSASASVLPVNIQDWFPLGLIGLISLQSKSLTAFIISITCFIISGILYMTFFHGVRVFSYGTIVYWLSACFASDLRPGHFANILKSSEFAL